MKILIALWIGLVTIGSSALGVQSMISATQIPTIRCVDYSDPETHECLPVAQGAPCIWGRQKDGTPIYGSCQSIWNSYRMGCVCVKSN